MDSFVISLLKDYLDLFFKNFDAKRDLQINFRKGHINVTHLELNDDVFREIIGVETLDIHRLYISDCFINVFPTKLTTVPISIEVGVMEIVLVELEKPKPLPKAWTNMLKKRRSEQSNQSKTDDYGLKDKITDGIRLTIRQINIVVRTKGRMGAMQDLKGPSPIPLVVLSIDNFEFQQTDSNWKVVDLSAARHTRTKNDMYIFREAKFKLSLHLVPMMDMTDASASLLKGAKLSQFVGHTTSQGFDAGGGVLGSTELLNKMPVYVQLVFHRKLKDNMILGVQATIIFQSIKIRMNPTNMAMLQDVLEAFSKMAERAAASFYDFQDALTESRHTGKSPTTRSAERPSTVAAAAADVMASDRRRQSRAAVILGAETALEKPIVVINIRVKLIELQLMSCLVPNGPRRIVTIRLEGVSVGMNQDLRKVKYEETTYRMNVSRVDVVAFTDDPHEPAAIHAIDLILSQSSEKEPMSPLFNMGFLVYPPMDVESLDAKSDTTQNDLFRVAFTKRQPCPPPPTYGRELQVRLQRLEFCLREDDIDFWMLFQLQCQQRRMFLDLPAKETEEDKEAAQTDPPSAERTEPEPLSDVFSRNAQTSEAATVAIDAASGTQEAVPSAGGTELSDGQRAEEEMMTEALLTAVMPSIASTRSPSHSRSSSVASHSRSSSTASRTSDMKDGDRAAPNVEGRDQSDDWTLVDDSIHETRDRNGEFSVSNTTSVHVDEEASVDGAKTDAPSPSLVAAAAEKPPPLPPRRYQSSNLLSQQQQPQEPQQQQQQPLFPASKSVAPTGAAGGSVAATGAAGGSGNTETHSKSVSFRLPSQDTRTASGSLSSPSSSSLSSTTPPKRSSGAPAKRKDTPEKNGPVNQYSTFTCLIDINGPTVVLYPRNFLATPILKVNISKIMIVGHLNLPPPMFGYGAKVPLIPSSSFRSTAPNAAKGSPATSSPSPASPSPVFPAMPQDFVSGNNVSMGGGRETTQMEVLVLSASLSYVGGHKVDEPLCTISDTRIGISWDNTASPQFQFAFYAPQIDVTFTQRQLHMLYLIIDEYSSHGAPAFAGSWSAMEGETDWIAILRYLPNPSNQTIGSAITGFNVFSLLPTYVIGFQFDRICLTLSENEAILLSVNSNDLSLVFEHNGSSRSRQVVAKASVGDLQMSTIHTGEAIHRSTEDARQSKTAILAFRLEDVLTAKKSADSSLGEVILAFSDIQSETIVETRKSKIKKSLIGVNEFWKRSKLLERNGLTVRFGDFSLDLTKQLFGSLTMFFAADVNPEVREVYARLKSTKSRYVWGYPKPPSSSSQQSSPPSERELLDGTDSLSDGASIATVSSLVSNTNSSVVNYAVNHPLLDSAPDATPLSDVRRLETSVNHLSSSVQCMEVAISQLERHKLLIPASPKGITASMSFLLSLPENQVLARKWMELQKELYQIRYERDLLLEIAKNKQ